MIDLQKPKMKLQSQVFMQKTSTQEVSQSHVDFYKKESNQLDVVSRGNSTTASALTNGNMMNCDDFAPN